MLTNVFFFILMLILTTSFCNYLIRFLTLINAKKYNHEIKLNRLRYDSYVNKYALILILNFMLIFFTFIGIELSTQSFDYFYLEFVILILIFGILYVNINPFTIKQIILKKNRINFNIKKSKTRLIFKILKYVSFLNKFLIIILSILFIMLLIV